MKQDQAVVDPKDITSLELLFVVQNIDVFGALAEVGAEFKRAVRVLCDGHFDLVRRCRGKLLEVPQVDVQRTAPAVVQRLMSRFVKPSG